VSLARLLALAAAGAAALALAASAAGTTIPDPNDVNGTLDLRTLTATSSAGAGWVTVTVRTWGTWMNGVLASAGPNRLVVLFDTDLDDATEYRARIVRLQRALVVVLSGQVPHT
jgi:hypothetical protein